ncbi:MAG: hypothetical protein AAFN10_00445 [Bacteroidota bacterium]
MIARSKLILGLKSLSEIEHASFKLLLSSPYFNQQQRSAKLYLYLQQFAPQYEHLTYEKVFRHLFPQEDFNAQRVREQFSFLYRLLKQFWVQAELEQSGNEAKILLVRQLRKRKLTSAFNVETKAFGKQLDQQKQLDIPQYWNRYQLAWEQAQFNAQLEKRVEDKSLPEAIEQLDQWYYLQKLNGTNELLNRQRILQTQYPIRGLAPLLVALEDESFHAPPLLQAYLLVYQLMEHDQKEDYLELIHWLNAHQEDLPWHESRALYKHGQNYCIRCINKGDITFEKELLSLYQSQLLSGLMLENGHLVHTDYKNIVTVGLRQKELAWVEGFMEQYKERVIPKFRANVYNFCRASFLEAKGKISEAIRLLQQVAFSDVYYQLSAKHLLLRCYYEVEDWETLHFYSLSFKAFLQRNQEISQQNRRNHLNFIRHFLPLLRLRERAALIPDQKFQLRLKAYQNRLEQATQTAHLGWLKTALEALAIGEITLTKKMPFVLILT